jgi:hypothetical protein
VIIFKFIRGFPNRRGRDRLFEAGFHFFDEDFGSQEELVDRFGNNSSIAFGKLFWPTLAV